MRKKIYRDKIINYLRRTGGGTIADMRRLLGIPHQSLTGILSQLHDDGIVTVKRYVSEGEERYAFYVYVPADNVDARFNIALDRLRRKVEKCYRRQRRLTKKYHELFERYKNSKL